MRNTRTVLAILATLAFAGCAKSESSAEHRAKELIPPHLRHAEELEHREEAEGKTALKEREARIQREKGAEALGEKRREEAAEEEIPAR